MLRNITLSADEDLIRLARQKAQAEQSTLNAEFRAWLTRYAARESAATAFDAVLRRLDRVHTDSDSQHRPSA